MKIFAYTVSLLLAFLTLPLHGQSKSELEARRKKMQQDIEYTRTILKKTSAKKSAALHNLNTLNVIISKRNNVIEDLSEEIGQTENEIKLRNLRLSELKKAFDLEKLRMHKTVVKAYKTRKNANELAFVFASASFRQALKRLKYLKKLSEYRSFLIARIEGSRDSVQAGIAALENTRKEKHDLLSVEEKEKQGLEKDKAEKSKVVKQLSGEENALRKKIRKNEQAIAKLNSAISRIVAQEIAAARKKAQAQAAKTASSSGSTKAEGTKKTGSANISLTPEARELSNNFAANNGALPWPVERGYISQTFGVHNHPDLPGITLINNGIDITTSENSNARAVFKGTVSAIINIPGQEKAVLVNHGEYFTVYSRLSEVYVSKGQNISAKQNLGKVWTDDEGKTVLQFQVWKGQEKQNPASWLAGK